MNQLHFISSFTAHKIANVFRGDAFILDDEAICDTALNAMLLIMNSQSTPDYGISEKELMIDDYGPMVSYGIRFPWRDRITFQNYIDLTNDELPEQAVIGRTIDNKGIYASCAYITRLSKKVKTPQCLHGADHYYRVGYIKGYDRLSRAITTNDDKSMHNITTPGFAAIFNDGICIGAKSNGKPDYWFAQLLSYVIGLHNDRRYFWNVTAFEEHWENYPAKAHFSIDQEFIKSLFYARSVPCTEKGRMRPILHWVKSHKRRLEKGIEIDINKHLRGIESFQMHDVNFAITSPRKVSHKQSKNKIIEVLA